MENEDTEKSTAHTEATDRLKFHYIKSNMFRVIHADGIWGGLTPQLDIQMAVFSERLPIPLQVVQEIGEDGTLGRECVEERVSRDGVVREVEANLVFSVEVARKVVQWLEHKIRTAEEVESQKKSKAEEVSGVKQL